MQILFSLMPVFLISLIWAKVLMFVLNISELYLSMYQLCLLWYGRTTSKSKPFNILNLFKMHQIFFNSSKFYHRQENLKSFLTRHFSHSTSNTDNHSTSYHIHTIAICLSPIVLSNIYRRIPCVDTARQITNQTCEWWNEAPSLCHTDKRLVLI